MYLRLSTIRSRFYAADHRGINAWKDPVTPFTFLSRGFIDRITRKCTNALGLLALLQCFTTFTRQNIFYFTFAVFVDRDFSPLNLYQNFSIRTRIVSLQHLWEMRITRTFTFNGEVSWIFRLVPTYANVCPLVRFMLHAHLVTLLTISRALFLVRMTTGLTTLRARMKSREYNETSSYLRIILRSDGYNRKRKLCLSHVNHIR
jgi:hypothetical protein